MVLLRNGGGRNFERRKGIEKMNGTEGGKSGAWGRECVYLINIYQRSLDRRAWVSSRTQRDMSMRTGPQRPHCGVCVWVTLSGWSRV